MENITLTKLYKKVVGLENKMHYLETSLIPTEKVSKAYLKKLDKIEDEMKKGKFVRLEDLK